VLSVWNAQLLVSTTSHVVLPLCLWYGGLGLLIAGWWSYKAANTFAATTWCSYAAFFLSYATLVQFWSPSGYASPTDVNSAIGLYLLMWTIHTGYMFVASLRTSVLLAIAIGSLLVTFALLTSGAFNPDASAALRLTQAGGWFGIFSSFCALYGAAAIVINITWGAQLIPLGVIGPALKLPPYAFLPVSLRRRFTSGQTQTRGDDDKDSS